MAREIVNDQGSVQLECIPSKNIAGIISDRLVTTVLSENPLNPLHYVPMEERRNIWGSVTKFLFPSVSVSGSVALQRAEEVVLQGYGLVVAIRHFSNNDFLMLTGYFRDQSNIADGKKIATPLAYHMYTRSARRLLEYFGVKPLPLVTLETKYKGKNYDAAGKELKLGTGSGYYQKTSIDLLNNGGILFIAPSATRTAKHEPWRFIKPIEMLIKGTNDRVAFVSVGLDIADPNVTDYEKYRGYNLRTGYIINIGETLTKQELVARAQEKGISVDRLVSDQIAMLVRPGILGDSYKLLREQRLGQAV